MIFNRRTIILFVGFLVSMLLIATLGRSLILKNTASQYTPSTPTGQALTESLTDPADSANIQKEGVDYNLKDKKYFENKDWLVATVEAIAPKVFEPSTVVMKRDDTNYSIVLGPGTDFPADSLPNLPADVLQYLKDIGRIAGSEIKN